MPTLKKPDTKTIIAVLTASAGMISIAAKKMKVSSKTLYRWINSSKELRREIELIRNSMVDLAEVKLIENIQHNDVASIIFFLKCIGKNRGYVEKQITSHEGDMVINITYDDKN